MTRRQSGNPAAAHPANKQTSRGRTIEEIKADKGRVWIDLSLAVSSKDEQRLREVLRKFDEIELSMDEAQFNEDNNPLYVWMAIEYCTSSPQNRFDYFLPISPEDQIFFLQVIRQYFRQLTLPEWCLAYLGRVSPQLITLAFDASLNPPVASTRSLQVFGLVQRGWNAFAAFAQDWRQEETFLRFEDLAKRLGSRSKARQAFLEEMTERNLQKLVARKRARKSTT